MVVAAVTRLSRASSMASSMLDPLTYSFGIRFKTFWGDEWIRFWCYVSC